MMFSTLFAEENNFDELLSKYREANELHKETKDEKSGHLMVFSRSDLDKMQAYTLSDVLKTVKMFSIKNTTYGSTTLVKSPYSESTMSSIKIYINSYELTSITSGTGLAQFGKMGLNFIDHIEVYQASNAIAFHGEPGNMVIKLYTKNPSRENATVVQLSTDTNGGKRAQVIDAQSFDEYSYLANADISKNNYEKETNKNGSTLSRDGARGQVYFNFEKKNDYLIEGGSAREDYDLFNGFGKAITDGGIIAQHSYLQFTKYLPYNTELIFSTTYETLDVKNSDSLGIHLFDGSQTNALNIKSGSYTYDLLLKKHDTYGDNNFLYGAQIKQKTFFLDYMKGDGIEKNVVLGPKNLDIYMLFLEDTYDINSNNQIILGVKLDYFKNHFTKSSKQNILRLAYISKLSDELSLKTFFQKGYVYPIMTQTTFSPIYNANPYLKNSDINVAKAELEYARDALTLTIGGGASKSKNGIVFDHTQNMYINNDKNSDFAQIFFNALYKFDAENKIFIECYRAFKENAMLSSDTGALAQLYTTFGKFDIYNELVYRSSYSGIDSVYVKNGYDYTAGVIYHYDKNIDIKLKGENIFDKAIQTSINGAMIPALERRVILTLEYIF